MGCGQDIGSLPDDEPAADGLWAVLEIPKFPKEFVLDTADSEVLESHMSHDSEPGGW